MAEDPNMEIVSQTDHGSTVVQIGNWKFMLTRKRRIALSLAALCTLWGFALPFISEFDQTRGIMSLAYSRLWLGGICIFVFLSFWLVSAQLTTRKLAFVFSATSAILAFFVIDAIAPKPLVLEAVTVNPSHVTFDSLMHREQFVFTVRNNTDSHQYGIQLKLKFPLDSSLQDFELDLAKDSRKPIIEGSGIADTIGALCVDHELRPTILLRIYRIDPHAWRDIVVTHMADSRSSAEAKISFFTDVPLPNPGTPEQSVNNFHIDENNLKCSANDGIGWWLDPSKPPRVVTFSGRKL